MDFLFGKRQTPREAMREQSRELRKVKEIKQEISAFEYKDQGNRLYNLHRYDDAVAAYTRAIMKNPSVPTFFTNRALCYLKIGNYELAAQDCRRGLEMEPNLIKGHFFLGQALMEMEHFDDAIKHLQRAHDLAKEQRLNFGEEIAYQLRVAKKKRWNLIEEKRIKEEIELQTYLNDLIEKDRQRQLEDLKQQLLNKASSAENDGASGVTKETIEETDEFKEGEKQIEDKTNQYLTELNSMFSALDIRRRKRDIPDYLCGKISFEIMRDPVITPSGITYDKKDIEDHIQRVGHFDPVTRCPLTQDQLIPNLAMKEVVDTFLAENEWANYY